MQDITALQADGPAPVHSVWLDSLDLNEGEQGWGDPGAGAGKSVAGHPITLGGKVFSHGWGTHSVSTLNVILNGCATRFTAAVGVDDETAGKGSVTFSLVVDGTEAAHTDILRSGDAPRLISVDLTGAKKMTLQVGDGGDGNNYDHADWAGGLFTLAADAASQPRSDGVSSALNAPARLVIPQINPVPAIHGAQIIGATPGRPFLFHIAATGTGPLTYRAKNLPAGLKLDSETGIITGSLAAPAHTAVTITVKGPDGSCTRTIEVVGGQHRLTLTPPMGWNSWNVWGGNVDAQKVRDAADEMVKAGLAAHGYSYVNIDDTWEAGRDAKGNIQSNEKFPDMKALTDYIHAKGLYAGIYSSPGPTTCGGYTGSYLHEQQDADSYAAWGFDYLKYDWCSYGNIAAGDNSLAALEKPYKVMRTALDGANRDIVFSFCQYGMGDVWTWGGAVGGNLWRTTGDITDRWDTMHDRFESQAGHTAYAGPGRWNDPDMLVVGSVGWGNPQPSHLKPNEQITHITMWCLLASPLLIGCDMTRLDPFTLALLTNDEALAVDQDLLGQSATRIRAYDNGLEVWARPLSDGTRAVGLINCSTDAATIDVRWSDLGLKGAQPARDLWLHRDLGVLDGGYSVEVPAHGAVLLKIGKP